MENNYYLYGIALHEQPIEHLSTLGIAELPVLQHKNELVTILYSPLESTESDWLGTRKNLIAHQKVIEFFLPHTTAAPFKFGTIANEETLNIISQTRKEAFYQELKQYEGKVEYNLKAFWKEISLIFEQIEAENPHIRELKEYIIATAQNVPTNSAMIEVGKQVQMALEQKKQSLAKDMIEKIKPYVIHYKMEENNLDVLFLQVALLIDKTQEQALDEAIQNIAEEYNDNIQFKYIGPSAPTSFMNLQIS
ncbi:MAG: hypothetical protein EAZ55_03805 [Cytophagales bacterium]|nr:MAG: hypothetical protein EAZ55_03805 [Cytophagales bacterium]